MATNMVVHSLKNKISNHFMNLARLIDKKESLRLIKKLFLL